MVSAQSRYYVAINFSSIVNFWHQSVTFGNKRHRFMSIICFFYRQHVIFKQIKESRNTKRVILMLYYISWHFYYFQYSAKTNTGITYSYHLTHALIHWYFNNVIAKFILKWIEREIWKKEIFFPEVARTRLREEGDKYRKFWQTLHTVFKEEGYRGVYR